MLITNPKTNPINGDRKMKIATFIIPLMTRADRPALVKPAPANPPLIA